VFCAGLPRLPNGPCAGAAGFGVEHLTSEFGLVDNVYTGWHADSIRFDFPELNEDTTDLEVNAPVWTGRLDVPKRGSRKRGPLANRRPLLLEPDFRTASRKRD